MKKEVENKNCFTIDLSSSEPSSDESDKEILVENKNENEKTVKKNSPKKTKKLVKKRETSSRNNVDQEKTLKPKKSSPKDSPKKVS